MMNELSYEENAYLSRLARQIFSNPLWEPHVTYRDGRWGIYGSYDTPLLVMPEPPRGLDMLRATLHAATGMTTPQEKKVARIAVESNTKLRAENETLRERFEVLARTYATLGERAVLRADVIAREVREILGGG